MHSAPSRRSNHYDPCSRSQPPHAHVLAHTHLQGALRTPVFRGLPAPMPDPPSSKRQRKRKLFADEVEAGMAAGGAIPGPGSRRESYGGGWMGECLQQAPGVQEPWVLAAAAPSRAGACFSLNLVACPGAV